MTGTGTRTYCFPFVAVPLSVPVPLPFSRSVNKPLLQICTSYKRSTLRINCKCVGDMPRTGSKNVSTKDIELSGADPGFGRGGGQLLRPKVANIVKQSHASKVSP